MLQNESADEELEHFEDIVEETDNVQTSAADKLEDNARSVQSSGTANIDSDSSEDDNDNPASNSDDEVPDKAEKLFVMNGPNDADKSKTFSSSSVQQSEASSKKSQLPGGYNPRHREPSFWSVIFPML